MACRSRAPGARTRCRSPTSRSPNTSSNSKTGCRAIGRTELFDENGKFREEFAALAPTGHRRMGSNPHANGGELLRPLSMPHFRDYAVEVPKPGAVEAEATRVLGSFLRDVMKLNLGSAEFPSVRPRRDRLEPAGGGLSKSPARNGWPRSKTVDIDLSPDGRVMEVLSEHLCEGWLEGYLLTGRHGLFSCYEAFIHIIDSMFNQHAKWLKVSREDPVAQADRLAELPADVTCLAAGP